MTSSSLPVSAHPKGPSRFRLYLQLGRVSNLPTVWSNVVAGTALGLGTFEPLALLLCMLGVSSLYVGGMFLNDAFDRQIDAVERPERPIPRGFITAGHVFTIGFALLATGIALAVVAAATIRREFSVSTLLSALLLSASIVLYDAWHKRNQLAPWIMGTCRGLVYVTAALALGGNLSSDLLGGAFVLLLYVVGLTWVARGERPGATPKKWPRTLLLAPVVWVALFAAQREILLMSLLGVALLLVWLGWSLAPLRSPSPKVPVAVIRMIAGISIVDGLLASSVLGFVGLLLGTVAALATLSLQRVARGT